MGHMLKQLQLDTIRSSQSEAKVLVDQISSRLSLVEDTLSTIEAQTGQMANRFAAGHDRLNDQCSKMGQAIEQGRLQSRALSGMAKSQSSKADNMEQDIRDVDKTLKEGIAREKE